MDGVQPRRSTAASTIAVIVLAAVWVYRLTGRGRAGLLWRVSRKMVLSYILIGAVPILLLVTFGLLAFLLRVLRRQLVPRQEPADGADRTGRQHSPGPRFSRWSGCRREAARRSCRGAQAALATRYPGVSVAIVPCEAKCRCGGTAGSGAVPRLATRGHSPPANGSSAGARRPAALDRLPGIRRTRPSRSELESVGDLRMVARAVPSPDAGTRIAVMSICR